MIKKNKVQIIFLYFDDRINIVLCDVYLYLLFLKELLITWLCSGYMRLEKKYGTKRTKYLLLFVSLTHTTILVAVKEGLLKEKGEQVIKDFEGRFKKNGDHKAVFLSVIGGFVFYAAVYYLIKKFLSLF